MKGDPTQYLGTVSVPLPAPPLAGGLQPHLPPAPLPPAAAPPAQLAGTQSAMQQAQLQASSTRLLCFCCITHALIDMVVQVANSSRSFPLISQHNFYYVFCIGYAVVVHC